MSISLERPLDYPASLLGERRRLPEVLYIMVDEIGASGLVATKSWDNNNFTKQGIESHLWQKFDGTVTSGLISAYEKEETALEYRPYTNPQYTKGPPGQAYLLTLSMEGLVPGWMTIGPGIHVPVWGQTGGTESMLSNFKANLWICLDEARVVWGLDERLGAEGEWLACGLVLRAKVVAHTKLQLGNSKLDHMERVFNDEEKEEADKAAKKERRRWEEEMEKERTKEVGKTHMKSKRKDPSQHPKASVGPQIPVRKSSINSFSIQVDQSANQQPPKLSITTRDAKISYTHADQNRATSLMKYALLMSHGRQLEAETTWLLETTPDTGLSRTPSTLTHDTNNIGNREEETETGSIIRRSSRQHRSTDLDTIPEKSRSMMMPSESARPSSRQQPRPDSRHSYREVNYYVPSRAGSDTHSDGERNSRSAAPSPSRSMFEHQQNSAGTQERSLRTRLSRNELLKELLQDDDSVIAEYARISLEDPVALGESKAHMQYDIVDEHANREKRRGVEEYRRTVAKQEATFKDRHDSISISPRTSSSHTAATYHYEAQKRDHPPPPSSIYSSHEPSDLNVPHASVEHPPHPYDLGGNIPVPIPLDERSRQRQREREEKIPTYSDIEPDLLATHTPRAPSRSDPFVAKGKEWKEKGNELRDRLVGLGSIGRKKGEKEKRDMWDVWGDAGK